MEKRAMYYSPSPVYTDLVIGVFVPRATVSDSDESVEATVRVVRGAVSELEAVTVGLSAVGKSAAGMGNNC